HARRRFMPQALPRLRAVTHETTRTHCPYCAFQCGMTVTKTEASEESVRIAADPDFPVNRGQMCIKGFTSAALLDHPARLRSPMMRQKNGRLAPVGWEAALDFVAERIAALSKAHGPASIGAFGSGALTNEKAYLLGKFVRVVLRSPNI